MDTLGIFSSNALACLSRMHLQICSYEVRSFVSFVVPPAETIWWMSISQSLFEPHSRETLVALDTPVAPSFRNRTVMRNYCRPPFLASLLHQQHTSQHGEVLRPRQNTPPSGYSAHMAYPSRKQRVGTNAYLTLREPRMALRHSVLGGTTPPSRREAPSRR